MITSSHDFSGFLTASDINQALGTNSSMNPISVLEDEPRGNINQPIEVDLRSQEQMGEPQAHSSLLEPEEVPADSAKVDEAETEPGKPKLDRMERRRNSRRHYRQRRALARKFSRLSTDQNGQGNLGTGASGNSTEEVEPKPTGSVEPATKRGRNSPVAKLNMVQPAGSVGTAAKCGDDSPAARSNSTQPPGSAKQAAKRGRSSPGVQAEPKRPRQEDIPPGPLSFVEATRRDIVLSVTPLDSEGNQSRATTSDRLFIMKNIEQYISRKNPNINIIECSLRGNMIRIRCLNQKTLEVVKKVVSPLKGPGRNLQGYQCLGPGDRPPLTTYGVWVEKPVPKKAELIGLLWDANSWLNPSKLAVKAEIPKGRGTTFLVGVEPEIKAELEKRKFSLRYGAGRTAHFKEKPKGQLKDKRGNP